MCIYASSGTECKKKIPERPNSRIQPCLSIAVIADFFCCVTMMSFVCPLLAAAAAVAAAVADADADSASQDFLKMIMSYSSLQELTCQSYFRLLERKRYCLPSNTIICVFAFTCNHCLPCRACIRYRPTNLCMV